LKKTGQLAAAKTGGNIAGNARRQLEQESGKLVVSKESYLNSLSPILIETAALELEDNLE
jgi:hypothetical protein